MKNRNVLTGSALAILAVLLVAVILLSNSLFRGARADLTSNRLYTLSEGTKKILSSIEEPIRLQFFFSDKGTQDNQQVRTYAGRVRELLEEMAARAGGKLKIDVIDPLPYSEDEDRATALGVQAIPAKAGDNIFLGLAGTNSTSGKAVLPLLDPNKEEFLEYDVAKLIHELSISKKPVVGLLSSLPISAGFDPATRQMRDPWAVEQQLEQTFEVRQLNAAQVKSIDKEISVLVLVHPKELTDDALDAIDQYVLRGGHVVVFVDPNAELDESGADPNNPQAAMFANKSSDLPKLFKSWGIEYDPGKVVLDRAHALQIRMAQGAPPISHPAILGFTKADLSPDDVTTAKLQQNINFSSAGSFKLSKESKALFVPLIQSSDESMAVPTERVKFTQDPRQLSSDYKPSGERFVIAGRLQGKFKSAFPERTGADHLAESKDDAQIVLVGDTDMLANRMWVEVQPFFGQKLLNAFASNGDFFINTVDNLTGSSDLISIRGRASSQRPFSTVDGIRRNAERQFHDKEEQLQKQLTETERALTELQSGKSRDQAMILSPEQKEKLAEFQKRKLDTRKELRGVRRQMDANIESLGARLKWMNILLMPILVILAALAFVGWKRKQRRVA